MIERAGEAARLPFPVHVHMLRHSTGYALAARGMDTRRLQHFLGHASITNTVRYTAMSPQPFKDTSGADFGASPPVCGRVTSYSAGCSGALAQTINEPRHGLAIAMRPRRLPHSASQADQNVPPTPSIKQFN
jgi:hypothetical protein